MAWENTINPFGLIKKRNRTGFIILFTLAILLFIADLGTTLYFYDYLPFYETNPIYDFGGLTLIIILNLLFFVIVLVLYKQKSWFIFRFKTPNYWVVAFVYAILIMLIITRIYVVINNGEQVVEHINYPENFVPLEELQSLKQYNIEGFNELRERQHGAYFKEIKEAIPAVLMFILIFFLSLDFNLEPKFHIKKGKDTK